MYALLRGVLYQTSHRIVSLIFYTSVSPFEALDEPAKQRKDKGKPWLVQRA